MNRNPPNPDAKFLAGMAGALNLEGATLTQAAQAIGVETGTLSSWLSRYGLPRRRYGAPVLIRPHYRAKTGSGFYQLSAAAVHPLTGDDLRPPCHPARAGANYSGTARKRINTNRLRFFAIWTKD